jgi:hypothetical protein
LNFSFKFGALNLQVSRPGQVFQFQVRGFKSSSFKARPGRTGLRPAESATDSECDHGASGPPRRQLAAGRGQRPGAGLRVTSHLPGLGLGTVTAWDRDSESGPDSDAAAALTQADSDRRRRGRSRSALTLARDSGSVAGPGSGESRSRVTVTRYGPAPAFKL